MGVFSFSKSKQDSSDKTIDPPGEIAVPDDWVDLKKDDDDTVLISPLDEETVTSEFMKVLDTELVKNIISGLKENDMEFVQSVKQAMEKKMEEASMYSSTTNESKQASVLDEVKEVPLAVYELLVHIFTNIARLGGQVGGKVGDRAVEIGKTVDVEEKLEKLLQPEAVASVIDLLELEELHGMMGNAVSTAYGKMKKDRSEPDMAVVRQQVADALD